MALDQNKEMGHDEKMDQDEENDQNKEMVQNKQIIANWISTMILTSEKIEQGLKDRILNVMCDLVLNLVDSENEIINTDACKEKLLPAITECIKKWLSKGKIKMEKISARKLKTMTGIVKTEVLTKDQLNFFSRKIFELAPKWKGQVQTEALVLLNALSGQIQHQVNLSAYKLIFAMHGQEGRNLAAQLLWKSLEENPEKVRLNDNLLLNEEYKKLFTSGTFFYYC